MAKMGVWDPEIPIAFIFILYKHNHENSWLTKIFTSKIKKLNRFYGSFDTKKMTNVLKHHFSNCFCRQMKLSQETSMISCRSIKAARLLNHHATKECYTTWNSIQTIAACWANILVSFLKTYIVATQNALFTATT